MKQNLIFTAATLCAFAFCGVSEASTTTFYYSQAARRTHLPSGQVTTEEVLLARTVDPEQHRLTEIACIKSPGRATFLMPIYMVVTGTDVQIADNPDVTQPKTVSGTGTVSGPDWNWNYLKFSMLYIPYSVRIEDVNVVTATQLIARKEIFNKDGTASENYDVEMDLITLDQFQAHESAMGCPP